MPSLIDSSDLPELQSIHLGTCALFGDDSSCREGIHQPPFNYKNTITMKSDAFHMR